jgi:hypothetical protein
MMLHRLRRTTHDKDQKAGGFQSNRNALKASRNLASAGENVLAGTGQLTARHVMRCADLPMEWQHICKINDRK